MNNNFENNGQSPNEPTLPVQGKAVSLQEIADNMLTMPTECTVYFKRTTGEFIPFSDYEFFGVDNECEDSEYMKELRHLDHDIKAHEGDGTYTALPSRFDIHDYSIMEDFCSTIENRDTADDLRDAIKGRGAFQRFKSAIYHHAIEKDWFAFKHEAYKKIAKEWCEENEIEYADENEPTI